MSTRFVCMFAAVLLWPGVFGIGGAQEDADPLPRLASLLDGEPVAILAVRDIHQVSARFAATALAAMLSDPSYERGAAAIERDIVEALGTTPRMFIGEHEKNLSGPLLLALVNAEPPAEAQGVKPVAAAVDTRSSILKLVVVAPVPSVENGNELRQHWPKAETNFGMISSAALKCPLENDLPSGGKIAPWAAAIDWPEGEILLRVRPGKLVEAAKSAATEAKALVEGFFTDTRTFAKVLGGSGIEALTYSVSFEKTQLFERLAVDLEPAESGFSRLVSMARERPFSWDSILAATPSDGDAAVLVQTDPASGVSELPLLMQVLERSTRGRKWAKLAGDSPEALDPKRFHFLFERMQGAFSITGRMTITGDLRLTVGAAVKGADVEDFRKELVAGLKKTGADFETLFNARKIGGVAPLGSVFQTKGKFGSPLIGLSAGWAWLCSSTAAYQELTDAFRNSRTLAGIEQKRAVAARLAENPPVPDPKKPPPRAIGPLPPAPGAEWNDLDSARLEINLERVLKIGYAAWLLTSSGGPMIGETKIPNELLPSPAIFAREMGILRAGLRRSGNRLELRSRSTLPGIPFAILGGLQFASEAVEAQQLHVKELAEKAKQADAEAVSVPLPPKSAVPADAKTVKPPESSADRVKPALPPSAQPEAK